MAKYTKTGKPRCSRCLRVATHKMEANSGTAYSRHEKIVVYHCDKHKTHIDTSLQQS
jgi:hypothetical protein